MVTHFPALEATSFIPECASGSDLRKCRRSLPMGREPQPSLKSGDIYRVASGRDSDAARLGTKRVQILGPAWSSGCYWLDSGQWSRAGQEEGACLVSPLLLAPCPEAQVGGAAGVWGQLEAPSPHLNSGGRAQPVISSGLLGPLPLGSPATCPLPAGCGS